MRGICRDILKRNIGRGDNATKMISLIRRFLCRSPRRLMLLAVRIWLSNIATANDVGCCLLTPLQSLSQRHFHFYTLTPALLLNIAENTAEGKDNGKNETERIQKLWTPFLKTSVARQACFIL